MQALPCQLKTGRTGTVARSTFSNLLEEKLKLKRQPRPGSSVGEVTPWGFLGLFPLWGWTFGSLGMGPQAGRWEAGLGPTLAE